MGKLVMPLVLLASIVCGCSPAVMVVRSSEGIGTYSSNSRLFPGQGSVYAVKGLGLIYSHTRKPLMLNAKATKVSGGNSSKGSVLELQMQTFRVTWSENAIGEIAKATGMDTVYYADIEELRILGFWATYTVHIYGSTDGKGVHLEIPSGRTAAAPPPKDPPN